MCLARHGLTRERGGVEQTVALRDDAVERDALARADDDGLADLHLVGKYLLLSAVTHDACCIGTDIHEGRDGAAGALHGIALEPLANLVEQHDGDALGVVTEGECADGGDRHEEVLVKDAPVTDARRRAPENVPPDERVCCEEEYDTDDAVFEDHSRDEECCCSADAHEHPLLFLRHVCFPLFSLLRLEYGVRLDGLGDLLDLCNDLVKACVVRVERHALAEKVDANLVHTLDLCRSILNLLSAVGAVDVAKLECLFHDDRLLYSNNI